MIYERKIKGLTVKKTDEGLFLMDLKMQDYIEKYIKKIKKPLDEIPCNIIYDREKRKYFDIEKKVYLDDNSIMHYLEKDMTSEKLIDHVFFQDHRKFSKIINNSFQDKIIIYDNDDKVFNIAEKIKEVD